MITSVKGNGLLWNCIRPYTPKEGWDWDCMMLEVSTGTSKEYGSKKWPIMCEISNRNQDIILKIVIKVLFYQINENLSYKLDIQNF